MNQLPAEPRLPLGIKIGYTLFMAVLVPVYWQSYGPTNFLYFCDVALFLTLVAVWTERPIWASLPAVGILLPQTLWCLDFVAVALGAPLLGMTDYMFNPQLTLFARGLSLFHGWLPWLLLWLVWRLGYDRRAFAGWTVLAWGLLTVCYFIMPAPPAPPDDPNRPVNINYVYGLNDAQTQTWLPADAWFALLMLGLPLLMYWPTHRFLLWIDTRRARAVP